jgi:hypothetical protein
VRGAQVIVDLRFPFVPGADAAIMPADDDVAALEKREMLLKLIPHDLVTMGIGIEDLEGHVAPPVLECVCNSKGSLFNPLVHDEKLPSSAEAALVRIGQWHG